MRDEIIQFAPKRPLKDQRVKQWDGKSFGVAWFMFFGATIFCLISLPIAVTRIPPLVDYINHLARIYVISLHGGDTILSQYYTIKWRPIPNLAMDVIVPPLVRSLGVYGAGKVFLLLTIALLLTGPHAIQFALLKRLSIGPFVASLFTYNESLSGGLTNYLFGVGLALWGVALWIAMDGARFPLRAVTAGAFIAILFFCHLAAAGVYLVSIVSFEMWLVYADSLSYRRHLYGRLAAITSPMLMLLLLHLLQPSSDIVEPTQWTLMAKVRGIAWTFESQHLFRIPDAAVSLALIACAALAAWRSTTLRIHPAGLFLAFVAFCVFLIVPSQIMGASGVDSRLPVAFLFVLIGFLDWKLSTQRARIVFTIALIATLAARIGFVEYAWQGMAIDTSDMARSAGVVRPGSKVIVVQVDHPNYPTGTWLYYLPCLMTIERSSLVSLLFSDPTQQIIAVNPPFRAITGGYNDDPPTLSELIAPPRQSPAAPSGRIYWADWQSSYDYVYLISLNAESPSVPNSLTEVYAAHHFRLYAVNKGPLSAHPMRAVEK